MQWTGGQVYSLQSTVSNANRAFQAKLMVARHSSVRGLMACIPFRWFVDGDAPVKLVMHELLETSDDIVIMLCSQGDGDVSSRCWMSALVR